MFYTKKKQTGSQPHLSEVYLITSTFEAEIRQKVEDRVLDAVEFHQCWTKTTVRSSLRWIMMLEKDDMTEGSEGIR